VEQKTAIHQSLGWSQSNWPCAKILKRLSKVWNQLQWGWASMGNSNT